MSSLEEIQELINVDPELYRFYLMRVNYYAGQSKHKEIRDCEIKFMSNLDRGQAIRKSRDIYNRIKESPKVYTKFEETKHIVSDFERVLGLEKRQIAFFESLDENDFSTVLKMTPTNSVSYNERAIYIRKHFPDQKSYELDDLNKSIALNPMNYIALFNRGNYYYDRGEVSSALRDFKKSCKTCPEFTFSLSGQAWCYFELNEYENAVEFHTKEIEISEQVCKELLHDIKAKLDLSASYYNRAICFEKLGDSDSELRDYKKCLDLNPKDLEALSGMGALFRDKKRYELALLSYSSALEINTKYLDGLYGRAKTYMELALYELAIMDFTSYLVIKKWKYAYLRRGQCYLEQERFEHAILDFSRGKALGEIRCTQQRDLAVELLKKKILRM